MFLRKLHTQSSCLSCGRVAVGTTYFTQIRIARLYGSIATYTDHDLKRSNGLSIDDTSGREQKQDAKRHGGVSTALGNTLWRSIDPLEPADGSDGLIQAGCVETNESQRKPVTLYRASRSLRLLERAPPRPQQDKTIENQPKAYEEKMLHDKMMETFESYDRIEWDTLYKKLSETYHDHPGKEKQLFSEQCAFANTFVSGLTGEQLGQKWLSFSNIQRSSMVPSLLIGSLAQSAQQALFVLSNISPIPKRFYVTMLCLRYISIAHQEELRNSAELLAAFEAKLSDCRNFSCADDVPAKQMVMDTLLKSSNSEQNEEIIHKFLTYYPFAPPESYIPIIRYYLREKNIDRALDIFARLPQSSLQNPSPRLVSVRNDILKYDSIKESETGSNFELLPRLFALGIQPDASLHHIVIENAIASGVPNVAWDVFQYLQNQNFEVDPGLNARTHLVLLRDALNRENTEGVNKILTAILENEALHKDPYLIAYTMNVVRVSSFFNAVDPIEAMSRIMTLYDRSYTRKPLLRLRMFDDIGINVRTEALPEPSAAFLSFTIWNFILVQRSEHVVGKLWRRFIRLESRNDDVVRSCMGMDIVYNGFILHYARTLRTLTESLRVVKFMLDSGLCEPTARTWSLLVYGFLRHGQFEQAERIIQTMKGKGFTIESISEHMALRDPSAVDLASAIDAALDDRNLPDILEEEFAGPESLDGPEENAHDELLLST